MKIALITGGTGGLGTAMCTRLTADGYQVVANHLPSLSDNASKWQATLAATGTHCELAAADVTDGEQCRLMADSILEHFGPVSLLVNNAGITRDATLAKLAADDWQAVINTNLNSLYNVTRPLLDSLRRSQHGRIVNISSVNGQRGQFGQTNYSAAKAGVHGFTRALAQELAGKGVTVNTVAPGFIDTDLVKAIPDAYRQAIIDAIPVGRIGQPDDVANAVSFLASERSGYITGIELSVNGGVYIQ